MKMKKLLAGVLSATMVATMIPAGMALGVSAEDETSSADSLVAYYDFTEGQTEGWTSHYGLDRAEGNDSITVTKDGVVFATNDYNTYSIENPLRNIVADGFTVVLDVSVPSTQTQNQYEGLFGFNSHGYWDWFGVTNSGLTLNMNATPVDTQYYFDLNNSDPVSTIDMSNAHYVMTVSADEITIYLNGEEVESYNGDTNVTGVSYGTAAMALANVAEYFDLGYWRYQGDWGAWGSAMTVSSVAFYNTALTQAEVEENYAQSIADSLNLEVIGMQKGTTNTSTEENKAIRFIANVDQSVVEIANVENLGWAYEVNASATEGNSYDMTSYTSAPVTTVTDNSSLCVNKNSYAYTILFESSEASENCAVAPYVTIHVGDHSYTFCYNGRFGSVDTTNSTSNIVYVPVWTNTSATAA